LHLLFFFFCFVLYSVQVYPAVLLLCFISAAVILFASLALMVQFSLPRNTAGGATVLYSFILVFFNLYRTAFKCR
jgi:hypothetical protein